MTASSAYLTDGTKPFAEMSAGELIAAVKRLLENDELSDTAAAAAATLAILTWEDARGPK